MSQIRKSRFIPRVNNEGPLPRVEAEKGGGAKGLRAPLGGLEGQAETEGEGEVTSPKDANSRKDPLQANPKPPTTKTNLPRGRGGTQKPKPKLPVVSSGSLWGDGGGGGLKPLRPSAAIHGTRVLTGLRGPPCLNSGLTVVPHWLCCASNPQRTAATGDPRGAPKPKSRGEKLLERSKVRRDGSLCHDEALGARGLEALPPQSQAPAEAPPFASAAADVAPREKRSSCRSPKGPEAAAAEPEAAGAARRGR